ncbi:MAG: hypothetical protein HUU20_15725 [Pirellulales bacterium]|nr:hypothetical protein [Pirellulales bacterium]
MLRAGNDGIVPRVGYGLQDQPSQLLAVLGQTAVPETYELRVGQQRGTVVDLVNHEKLTCRSGTDQSLKLVGLACYLRDDESWKNESGEEWSLERLLQEELDRSVALDDSAATNRLLGLTYALRRRARSQRPRDGQYARAEAFLDEFHRHALSLQNSDGSWHPRFFASRGESRDTIESLRSTGHILHWLTISLPDSRLQTAEILRAVNYLDNQLAGLVARWNTTSATPRKMDAVAHALGALTTYDQRVFQPYDTRPQTTNSAAAAEKN